jgi:hypothetical protein
MNYGCSTLCHNIGVGKFALEFVLLRYLVAQGSVCRGSICGGGAWSLGPCTCSGDEYCVRSSRLCIGPQAPSRAALRAAQRTQFESSDDFELPGMEERKPSPTGVHPPCPGPLAGSVQALQCECAAHDACTQLSAPVHTTFEVADGARGLEFVTLSACRCSCAPVRAAAWTAAHARLVLHW